jgi:ribose/xylose/arabinose/galactoside ABC-type transport system permease subunit
MTALARTISRLFLTESSEFSILKQIALFSLAGLLVTLLALTYGLDLSPGFF